MKNTEDLLFIQAGAEKARIDKANSNKAGPLGGTSKTKSNPDG